MRRGKNWRLLALTGVLGSAVVASAQAPIDPPVLGPNELPPPATSHFMPATTPAPLVAPAAPLLAVKQTLPEAIIPGQPVQAEITITNTGGKAADNVILAGWWTAGYDLAETSVAAQSVNGRRTWGMGSIPAGESRSVKIKLSAVQGITITEFHSGFDATCSSATDTRTVKVLKQELSLQLVAPDTVVVGQPVAIQIRIKNPSTVPVIGVNIVSRLPDTITHPKGANLESELGVIAAGATEVIALDVMAARAGEGKTRVRISAPGCEPIEKDVRVVATEARVAVTLNGPKTLYQNWPATYEATIENQGDQPIVAAAFEVKLPPGFKDLRASDKPGYDSSSHRIVWSFDRLQPGEKKTVIWFGFAKQAEDLQTAGTVSVGGMPLKRSEWTTKNLGHESNR